MAAAWRWKARGAVVAAVIAGGCSSKSPAPPVTPPALARCDLETATTHTCTDVFDPARLGPHQKACANGTFTANASCPKQATTRGCVLPDGSLTWIYKGDVSCPRLSFTGTPPPYGAPQAYACQQDACLEEHSVYDTGPSHGANDCVSFRAAPCPLDHAIGRCLLDDPTMEKFLVISSSWTGDQAVVVCATHYHGTFQSM